MAICSSTWIQNYHCHTGMCKPSQSTSEQGCSLMGCPPLNCSQVRGFINPFIHVSNKLRLFGEVVLRTFVFVLALLQWNRPEARQATIDEGLRSPSKITAAKGGLIFIDVCALLTKSTPVRGLNGSNKTAITALQWHLVLLPGTVSFLKIKVC